MMLATQLKLLKEKRGLTNQQLADLSGVPVGTVNRILSGQTDNPSFQTICDLVLAMDGSLDELAGIEKEPAPAEAKGRVNHDLIHLYEKMIDHKNRWIHRLFVLSCLLASIFVFLVIFDLMNPATGFVRS